MRNSLAIEDSEEAVKVDFELLSKNVKYIRKLMRLTQGEFGRIFGVSNISIYAWEAGKNAPKIEHLARLAEVIGLKNPFDFYTIDLSTMRLKIQDKIVVITPREKN